LKDNPEICAEVENKVRLHYGLQGAVEETAKPAKKAAEADA